MLKQVPGGPKAAEVAVCELDWRAARAAALLVMCCAVCAVCIACPAVLPVLLAAVAQYCMPACSCCGWSLCSAVLCTKHLLASLTCAAGRSDTACEASLGHFDLRSSSRRA